MDYSLDPLEEQDALFDLAMALRAVAGNLAGANCSITRQPSAQGNSSWLTCTRALRWKCWSTPAAVKGGASLGLQSAVWHQPYRFVTLRRLDILRTLLLDRFSLVDAALAAGFHDQSHMTRHFTRTYGVSPSRWLERVLGQRQLAGSYKHRQ
jgi:AraC-like DNA-binding protein